MVTIYDVNPNKLIERVSEELKKVEIIKEPEWVRFVKTGASKERAPVERDWWYTRAASILRKVYVLGPIGVNKLRIKYGGKKNRGHKPERFYKGSGSVIRKILQQLEKAELVKQVEKGIHKGKIITPKGKKFLDKIANEIIKEESKKEEKTYNALKKDAVKENKNEQVQTKSEEKPLSKKGKAD